MPNQALDKITEQIHIQSVLLAIQRYFMVLLCKKVNVKLSLYFVPEHHAMKAYWGVEV
jgi:hypothetical protein